MNLDKNRQFPNQLIDGDPHFCVGLWITDTCANTDGNFYDPDFSIAAYYRLTGQTPPLNFTGVGPYLAACAAVVYGLQIISEETFNAKVMGEQYVANPANYSSPQDTVAFQFARKAVVQFNTFAQIAAWIQNRQLPAGIHVHWYPNFMTPNPDGTLPAPVGTPSDHMVAVYDYDQVKGFLVKPWLGAQFGQGGYVWISEAIFNAIWVEAYAFDPNGWRWLSLATIAVKQLLSGNKAPINDILAQMSASQTPAPKPQNTIQTPPGASQPAQAAQPSGPTYIDLAGAIRDYEGKPGDLNYLLNNPGDCRPSPEGYLPMYEPVQIIDTDTDPAYPFHKGKFAKFKDYQTGWLYLCNMLRNQIENHPNWTLIQLMTNFSPPSDGNDPDAYAANIGTRLKVDYQTFQIKNLV